MGSKELSNRKNWQFEANKQGTKKELEFAGYLSVYLFEKYGKKYKVVRQVRIKYPNNKNFIVLDICIENTETNKVIFIETKKQNYAGNAHERAYKYHPGCGLSKYIRKKYNMKYHPVLFVFSGEMISGGIKYIQEISLCFDDFLEIVYFDKGSSIELIDFIEKQILLRIDGEKID